MAMFAMVMRSSIERFATPAPSNCIARYVAPSKPISPMQWRMMSLAITPGCNLPSSRKCIVSGTLMQQFARAHHEARVRVADAGGELVERARHAGVRIRAEKNFAGPRVALLRQAPCGRRPRNASRIAGSTCPSTASKTQWPFGSSITS